MHSYAYLARKAFSGFIPRLSTVVFENAFVVQGNQPDELPEMVLACARVSRVDFNKVCLWLYACSWHVRGGERGGGKGCMDLHLPQCISCVHTARTVLLPEWLHAAWWDIDLLGLPVAQCCHGVSQ